MIVSGIDGHWINDGLVEVRLESSRNLYLVNGVNYAMLCFGVRYLVREMHAMWVLVRHVNSENKKYVKLNFFILNVLI